MSTSTPSGQPQPSPPSLQKNSPSMHMLCRQAPVIPVLTIEDLAHAVPLAEALIAGGLPVLEVALRTPVALQAISLMARVPGATIGAGTVLSPKHAKDAQDAGAVFAASPGTSHSLIDCCEDLGLPLLPGAVTATEIIALLGRGFDLIKFFPAEASGGVQALRSLSAPFPHVHFCPVGGISQTTAQDYLSLSNVTCVGGNWMASVEMLKNERWNQVRKHAHQARQLVNGNVSPLRA